MPQTQGTVYSAAIDDNRLYDGRSLRTECRGDLRKNTQTKAIKMKSFFGSSQHKPGARDCDIGLGVRVSAETARRSFKPAALSIPEDFGVSTILRSLVGSHAAAIAVGAIAAAAYLKVYPAYPANSQSLGDYIVAICAKAFHPASAAEAPYLADNVSAMTKMMINMGIRPSGDVDRDFVAMMVPHHQGAIEMAQAELRYGRNEQLRRLSQEIIVTQQQEIVAMRLALGERLPPSAPAPDQVPPAEQNQENSVSLLP